MHRHRAAWAWGCCVECLLFPAPVVGRRYLTVEFPSTIGFWVRTFYKNALLQRKPVVRLRLHRRLFAHRTTGCGHLPGPGPGLAAPLPHASCRRRPHASCLMQKRRPYTVQTLLAQPHRTRHTQVVTENSTCATCSSYVGVPTAAMLENPT